MMPRGIGRRGFTAQEPWVPLMIVVILAVIAMVTLRRIGRESKLRISVMHSLAMLADSQDAYRRRLGRFATGIGPRDVAGNVTLVPDSGAVVTIVHADSTGWSASATHPRLTGRKRTCYIYGGETGPHDPRLTRAREPRCW